LLSGTQSNIALNFTPTYTKKGLSFVFGKKGGINYLKTFQQIKSKAFIREIKSLPVEQYDLVINDFEPVSAWACKIKKIRCISVSHQFAVLRDHSPKSNSFSLFAKLILKHYAPCSEGIGFHFKQYGENTYTPVIRKSIRMAHAENLGHYTVYLPAYSDKHLIKQLQQFTEINWHIFSKSTTKFYKEKNCSISPVNAGAFSKSFISCEGIVCGAGFETPAEALYLGKKLLVIPMKGQYEQQCNAAALHQLGVAVIKKLSKKHSSYISTWLKEKKAIKINYPDQSEDIIKDKLFLKQNENVAINDFMRQSAFL
jgi:uncharacterized protein (TIGR00661 family)